MCVGKGVDVQERHLLAEFRDGVGVSRIKEEEEEEQEARDSKSEI